MSDRNIPADKHVWIPAERVGQIEVREYVHGDQARHTISISEADLKLPTLVGGFVARNPDNHADQWYIARDYFNKHYRIPVETSGSLQYEQDYTVAELAALCRTKDRHIARLEAERDARRAGETTVQPDEKCGNCGDDYSKHLGERLICPDAAMPDIYRWTAEPTQVKAGG
jgi:hypothetical protein